MQPVTQKQIALALNISRPSVTLALSDNPEDHRQLRPETRRLILDTAAQMCYVPNKIARSFKTGRTRTIGVVSHLSNWLSNADWLSTVASEVDRAGYRVTLASVEPGDVKREKEHIEELLSLRVDGLMLFASAFDDVSYYQSLEARGIPLVLTGQIYDPKSLKILHPENLSFVRAEDCQGMYELTRHILDLGHREIAYSAGRDTMPFPEHRLTAFQRAMAEANVPIRPGWLMENESFPNRDTVREFTRKLVQENPRPTAILYMNDELALVGLHVLMEMGLRVPEDISIAGFGDLAVSQLTWPELTTVRLPIPEIVREASRLLITKIEKKSQSIPNLVAIKAPLIVRQSTGPVPRKTAG